MLGQLQSSRLVLRDVTLDDAQHFFQLDQDPEVMRFLGLRVLQKAGLSHAGRARYTEEDVELYRTDAARG